MARVFNPPAVNDVGPVPGSSQRLRVPASKGALALMKFAAPMPRGLWVLKIGGVYGTYDYPLDTVIASATEVYRGGTLNPVSDTVAAALEAAGYTVDTV